MVYRYLYQTKANENREGEIKAANRAEAYALLRKQGIRPYRVIGDDPGRLRFWLLCALGAVLIVIISVAATILLGLAGSSEGPLPRQQLTGDRTLIFDGVRNSWADYLDHPLDRYLAAYAQPGTEATPPLLTAEELATFAEGSKRTLVHADGDPPEVKQLRRILWGMRSAMSTALADGMSLEDCLEALETRQQAERDFRERAENAVLAAPAEYRYRVWRAANQGLRERGIEQLDVPAGLTGEE